ncbi:MAG: hypothetical protein N2515_02245 [Deltaproteobacteria bacterium]|nr:hypothetical protein [Deltaproteobacteria bacterium]
MPDYPLTGGRYGYATWKEKLNPRSTHLRIKARLGAFEVRSGDAFIGFGVFGEGVIERALYPYLAVVVNAKEKKARILSLGRVLSEFDFNAKCESYEIKLEPEGKFKVSFGSNSFEGILPNPPASLEAAIFGGREQEGPSPVWASEWMVEVMKCDYLSPAPSPSPVVEAFGPHDIDGLAVFPKSAANNEAPNAHEALITSMDQLYWFSVKYDDRQFEIREPANPFEAVIQPMCPNFSQFRHVHVFLHGGVHHLFLAAAGTGSQSFSIVHALYEPAANPSQAGQVNWNSCREILSPSDLGAHQVISVDSPSVAQFNQKAYLLFRALHQDETTSIMAYPLKLENNHAELDKSAPYHFWSSNQIWSEDAFDRDEVADPFFITIGNVPCLLYAGRRGTRWSIGMVILKSTMDEVWRRVETPILGPTNTGFAALGVRHPELVKINQQMELYHVGWNGTRGSVGMAVQDLLPSRIQ